MIIGALTVLFLSSFIALYPNGAPAAVTGSPGDGSDCTQCHGGTATTVAGWITSNIPASGYVPGQTYQITATNSITGSGKYGFEVSPQNAAGSQLGTLAVGSGTKLVGGTKYITHSNATSSLKTWTFNWTAPAAGTGDVTFYGSFARSHPGPVRLSTLVVNEQTATLPAAAGPITGPSSVCSGNSFNYSVGSINGATSYTWSVPTGATISSGQGTTSITVNFSASASSGNVSVYGSNTAGNGTPSSLPVTVSSAPSQPSAIAGTATPCTGTTQSYAVTNVSGVTYTWTVPSGSSISSGQGTNSITVAVGSNSGSVTAVPSNSCGNGTSVSKALTVSSIPSAAATPTGPDQVDIRTTSSSSYATTGAAGATSYVWDLSPANAGSISGTSTSATVTWDGAFMGDASISVKSVNACGDGTWSLVKMTHVINTTGVNVIDVSKVRVYPNPSYGHFTLELNGDKETALLLIMDASGKEVYKATVNDKGLNSLDLSLETGVYIMMINEETRVLKQKLFIQ